MDENIECENKECRLWIDYKEEYNCSLISIYEHGSMTLRQVAERLGISFARVKQLESRALEKLKKRSVVRDILF
jgi:DNA-directed RNA polymerase sigma subunit (sigma70/sigma32)